MSTVTVPAFVVLADSKEHANTQLGLFFRVVDADKFLTSLSTRDWANARIQPVQVAASDVHPAHRALFPAIFPVSSSN